MSPFRIRYMVSSFIIFGFNSSALSNNIGCDRPLHYCKVGKYRQNVPNVNYCMTLKLLLTYKKYN